MMPIEYYVGIDAPAIEVDNLAELYEAIDILHTQVLDRIGENSPALAILSAAMDAVQALIDDRPAHDGLTWAEKLHGIDGL